jgi:WD40 repeat protein
MRNMGVKMRTYLRQGLLIVLLGLIRASGFRALAQEQPTPTTMAENNRISAVTWSPDGNLIAAGNRNGQITLINASGDLLFTLSDHTSWVSDLSWNTDSTRLASVSVDGTLKLWDTTTGILLRTTVIADQYATAVIWTPDNREIITATSNEKSPLFVWDANTGALVSHIEAGSVVQMRWSPDDKLLAMANPGGGIALRDAKTLQFIRFIEGTEMGGQGYDDYSLAWKTDSSQVICGKLNGMLRIWDAVHGEIAATFSASKLE